MNEYRPGGFQILPPVVKNLIIINVLVYIASNFAGATISDFLYRNLSLYHWSSPLFRPWQLVTHMFMHAQFGVGVGITHILFNMFALWMFGNALENVMGPKRFLIFYFVSGIGAALCYLGVMSLGTPNPFVPMVGASGAIFGLLFAFGYLFPNLVVYVSFLIPLKAKYFVAIYAAIELFSGLQSNPTDDVAHFAHLGGMIFAFILLLIWKMSSKSITRY
jgi:membrane associated rhomboid family serine protease